MSRHFALLPLRQTVSCPGYQLLRRHHMPTGAENEERQKPVTHTQTSKDDQRLRELDLQDKIYAVTGGARGLGLAMAEALAQAGGQGRSDAPVSNEPL